MELSKEYTTSVWISSLWSAFVRDPVKISFGEEHCIGESYEEKL